MAHGIETMAFAGETPWHGLGNKVVGSITVDEMLVAAGLDWGVVKRPLFVEAGDEKIMIPNKMALMRDTDNSIFSVVGKDWQPFQNKDAMEFFRDYTESGGATLETAGSLHGGRVVWGLANIKKGFTLQGRDQVNGYILLIVPHESGVSNSARTTAVRVVCANTLAMALSQANHPEYRQSHAKAFDVSKAKETIQLAQEQMALHEEEAIALQKLKMNAIDTMQFLATNFQVAESHEKAQVLTLLTNPSLQNKTLGNVLASVVNAPGATPGNGWGLLNGVTHWADHVAGKSQDVRLYNSWMGSTGKIKLDVKRQLLEMADYKLAA